MNIYEQWSLCLLLQLSTAKIQRSLNKLSLILARQSYIIAALNDRTREPSGKTTGHLSFIVQSSSILET